MKIVLLGSPEFVIPTFENIIKHFEVVAIVTQPDRKSGRGLQLHETPVAKLAEKYHIKVFKPEKISSIEKELALLDFDLMLTFAYGQFIPSTILSLGKLAPLNIHGSLLPKYRGAAPVHHAILNGDKEIGITLMKMTKQMDAGDMYFKASQFLNEKTTSGEGIEIIASLAEKNIVNWLNQFRNVIPEKQSNDFTFSPKLLKEDGELKESFSISKSLRIIKAFNPYPGAFIYLNNNKIKILDAITIYKKNAIEINCSDGKIYAIEFQFENKKKQKI